MKNFLSIALILIVSLYSFKWLSELKPNLFVESAIESFKNKNYEDLKNKIDFKTISTTAIDAEINARNKFLLEEIKNTILGFFNQKQASELEQFLINYLTKEESNYLILDNELLTKVFNNIDYSSINYRLIVHENHKYIYEISAFNNLIEDNLSINLEITENEGQYRISDLYNFMNSLKQFRIKKETYLKNYNEKIKREMDRRLWITEFKSNTTQLFTSFGYTTDHSIKMQNKYDRSLIYAEFRIWTSDVNDRVIEQIVKSNKKLDPDKEDFIEIHNIDASFYVEMMHGNYPKLEILKLVFENETLELKNAL